LFFEWREKERERERKRERGQGRETEGSLFLSFLSSFSLFSPLPALRGSEVLALVRHLARRREREREREGERPFVNEKKTLEKADWDLEDFKKKEERKKGRKTAAALLTFFPIDVKKKASINTFRIFFSPPLSASLALLFPEIDRWGFYIAFKEAASRMKQRSKFFGSNKKKKQ
jgi:hypothetical protein